MVRTTTLIEAADGSGWTWAQYDRKYKTLVNALKAVDRESKRVAEVKGMDVNVREIYANTAVGRLIAKCLTEAA